MILINCDLLAIFQKFFSVKTFPPVSEFFMKKKSLVNVWERWKIPELCLTSLIEPSRRRKRKKAALRSGAKLIKSSPKIISPVATSSSFFLLSRHRIKYCLWNPTIVHWTNLCISSEWRYLLPLTVKNFSFPSHTTKVSIGDELFSMHPINLNTSLKVLEITNYIFSFLFPPFSETLAENQLRIGDILLKRFSQ